MTELTFIIIGYLLITLVLHLCLAIIDVDAVTEIYGQANLIQTILMSFALPIVMVAVSTYNALLLMIKSLRNKRK